MAKTQKESLLQRLVRKSLNVEFPNQAYTLKTHGDRYTAPGIPDILACVEGVFIGIECKMWRGRPSEAQALHMRDIIKAGGIGLYCIWNKDTDEYFWIPANYPFTYRSKGHWIPAKKITSNVKGREMEIIDCSFVKASILINKHYKPQGQINVD